MVSPVSGLGCSPGLVLFLQHDRAYWARRRTAFLRNLGPSLYRPFGVAPVPGCTWHSQLDLRPRADPCLSRGHDDFPWAFVRSAPRLLPTAADLPRKICRLASIRNKRARGLRAPGPAGATLPGLAKGEGARHPFHGSPERVSCRLTISATLVMFGSALTSGSNFCDWSAWFALTDHAEGWRDFFGGKGGTQGMLGIKDDQFLPLKSPEPMAGRTAEPLGMSKPVSISSCHIPPVVRPGH